MTQRSEVTTKQVMEALRTKYAGKDERVWAGGFYLEECGVNGNGVQSRCDALYAGFTAASGRLLVGHEVKVSRSDWLSELKKVGKADFWHDNCHQWYLVTVADVVREGELPEGWGLMLLQSGRLITKVRPTTRTVTPSWDALRSMLSRAETLRAASVQNALSAARQKVDLDVRAMENELRQLRRAAGSDNVTRVKIQQVVAKLEAEGWQYRDVDVDTLVQAVMAYEDLRHATSSLKRWLSQQINSARQLALTAKNAYGPLADLLKEMDDASGTVGSRTT